MRRLQRRSLRLGVVAAMMAVSPGVVLGCGDDRRSATPPRTQVATTATAPITATAPQIVAPHGAYEASAARICDTLNRDARVISRRARKLRARLEGDRTLSTRQQSRLLVENERRLLGMSDAALARLRRLRVPAELRATWIGTIAAWADNTKIRRRYAELFGSVRAYADFRAATRYDADEQLQMDVNSTTAGTGLARMGNGRCRRDARRPDPSIAMPNADPGARGSDSAQPAARGVVVVAPPPVIERLPRRGAREPAGTPGAAPSQPAPPAGPAT